MKKRRIEAGEDVGWQFVAGGVTFRLPASVCTKSSLKGYNSMFILNVITYIRRNKLMVILLICCIILKESSLMERNILYDHYLILLSFKFN